MPRGRQGQGGGPRKPAHLRVVEGTHRNDRHGSVEDAKNDLREALSSPIPDPPAHLDDYARATWLRLAPDLHARGLLTPRDSDAFADYCQATSDLAIASKALQADPLLPKAVSAVRAASNRLRNGAIEFGLTPSARARLPRSDNAGEKSKADHLRSRMNRGNAG